MEISQLTQSAFRTSIIMMPNRLSLPKQENRSIINFYKLVDQLKVSYGTFSAR